MKLKIILFLLIFSSHYLFGGGGWPKKENSYFAKLGGYSIRANKYFTPAGHLVDITTTGYYAASIYGEYGITNKLTGILYMPFFVRSTLNQVNFPNGDIYEEGDQLNSIGDMDIGLQYGWLDKNGIVSSVKLTLGLPFGEPLGGRTMLLQSGDGEFNQMIEILTSRSLFSGKGFGTFSLGLNNRTKGFSDEFRYGIEAGYKIKKFWVIMRSYGIKPLLNGDSEFISNNGIFSNNVEYLAISPEILIELTNKIGISMGAGFAVYGKRILGAPSYSLGIYIQN